ncbi:uncharacterized protein LOC144312780 isoform X2 [Canis aureus]
MGYSLHRTYMLKYQSGMLSWCLMGFSGCAPILGAIILYKVLKKIQTIRARRSEALLDPSADAETKAQICQVMYFVSRYQLGKLRARKVMEPSQGHATG